MAKYFDTPAEADIENFLKDQREIRGEEFSVPTREETQKEAQSMFSTYREAIGAPQTLTLSNDQTIVVGKPRVKSIKYLLSNIEAIQKKAENADKNPLGALEDFEKIMLDCLIFLKDETPESRQDWFDDLPADDGLMISEAFSKVFDIRYLLARSAGASGKK